jgi:hypothetical protein
MQEEQMQEEQMQEELDLKYYLIVAVIWVEKKLLPLGTEGEVFAVAGKMTRVLKPFGRSFL